MSFISLLFSFNLNFSINHCFSSTPPQLSLPENSNSFNVFPFTIVFDRIIITSLKLNKHSNLQQFFHTQQCPWRPIMRGHNYNLHPLLAQITVVCVCEHVSFTNLLQCFWRMNGCMRDSLAVDLLVRSRGVGCVTECNTLPSLPPWSPPGENTQPCALTMIIMIMIFVMIIRRELHRFAIK